MSGILTKPFLLTQVMPKRYRATYHQPSRRWVPRFVKRFYLQYPKSPFYFILGFCVMGFAFPYVNFFHKYCTLTKEEFIVYRENHNAVVRGRQKHGTDLYFPFFNEDKANKPPTVAGN